MSTSQYKSEQDKLESHINSFATQSFRDQADRDYIAARLACRFELMPQFLWASQQAIEKYLKAILLFNRIEATKVGHDIKKAQLLTNQLSFEIELSPRSQAFINLVSEYGKFRYIDVPYEVDGYVLIDLDLTIWELRRYCRELNVFGKTLQPDKQKQTLEAKLLLAKSALMQRDNFRLPGGIIEKIIDTKKHPSRTALLWNNLFYGVRKRSTVRVKEHFHAQYPMLYLHPEMLEEILKYVFIPKDLVQGYRDHLAQIKRDPNGRP